MPPSVVFCRAPAIVVYRMRTWGNSLSFLHRASATDHGLILPMVRHERMLCKWRSYGAGLKHNLQMPLHRVENERRFAHVFSLARLTDANLDVGWRKAGQVLGQDSRRTESEESLGIRCIRETSGRRLYGTTLPPRSGETPVVPSCVPNTVGSRDYREMMSPVTEPT